MSYQDGIVVAEAKLIRFDWFGKKKAKCDPRYGWKPGAGGKCERVSPKEDPENSFGTDVFLTETDKDVINNYGSRYIDKYEEEGGVQRKEALKYFRDEARAEIQDPSDDLGSSFDDYEDALSRVQSFYNEKQKGKKPKNKYGTETYLSKKEEKFIEKSGGLGNIPGFSKDKEVNYLRDVFMTQPKYSKNPQSDLDKVNKHYFGA